jgi:lipid A disaccharide synthetase
MDPEANPMVAVFGGPAITLVQPEDPEQLPYLKTAQGTQIFLWQTFPAHGVTSQCRLCVTTVGANTAELGALGVPMLVLLPTQQLEAMNAWDGLLGLLINLPLVGKPLNRVVNWVVFAYLTRNRKLFAWPNIWAGREVVPELFGPITAQQAGDRILAYLENPETLAAVRQTLQAVRGEPGAAQKLAALILKTVHEA